MMVRGRGYFFLFLSLFILTHDQFLYESRRSICRVMFPPARGSLILFFLFFYPPRAQNTRCTHGKEERGGSLNCYKKPRLSWQRACISRGREWEHANMQIRFTNITERERERDTVAGYGNRDRVFKSRPDNIRYTSLPNILYRVTIYAFEITWVSIGANVRAQQP